AVLVLPNRADHADGRSRARRRDRLVRALAAVVHREPAAEDRLARTWKSVGGHDEIDVDGPDDADALGHAASMPDGRGRRRLASSTDAATIGRRRLPSRHRP